MEAEQDEVFKWRKPHPDCIVDKHVYQFETNQWGKLELRRCLYGCLFIRRVDTGKLVYLGDLYYNHKDDYDMLVHYVHKAREAGAFNCGNVFWPRKVPDYYYGGATGGVNK